jgi:hypothetical protein
MAFKGAKSHFKNHVVELDCNLRPKLIPTVDSGFFTNLFYVITNAFNII